MNCGWFGWRKGKRDEDMFSKQALSPWERKQHTEKNTEKVNINIFPEKMAPARAFLFHSWAHWDMGGFKFPVTMAAALAQNLRFSSPHTILLEQETHKHGIKPCVACLGPGLDLWPYLKSGRFPGMSKGTGREESPCCSPHEAVSMWPCKCTRPATRHGRSWGNEASALEKMGDAKRKWT